MAALHSSLARARETARYSQDDAGAALGVSRTMISYWENGSRTPNDRQLTSLARLYGIELADLLDGPPPEPAGLDLAAMMLRATGGVDPASTPGLREFVQFLGRYAELAQVAGVPIRGLTQSPFVHRQPFSQKDDARRKAEEVRAHLRLGTGPLWDTDPVCEMLGVTIYRAPLGPDLNASPSGAFLNHPDVGYSILVNLDMTPGRRRFTVAHELAHALFHSSDDRWVVSHGRNTQEDFADEFAGEFLMPSEGIRRFMEESDMPPRITDAVDVVHVQRYFRVSFPTALVRLKQMNAITGETFRRLRRDTRPVALARALGYRVDPEEYRQDVERWRIRRFPRAFLRLLRHAVITEAMSPPSAAAFAGLSIPDLVQILGQPSEHDDEPEGTETEFAEFEASGVVARP